jgi:hypothetical protein
MVGRILDITQGCLTDTLEVDLIGTAATMLFPNDEIKRIEAEQTLFVSNQVKITRLLDVETLRDLVPVAADALPLREIQKRTTVTKGGPFVRGLASGEVL